QHLAPSVAEKDALTFPTEALAHRPDGAALVATTALIATLEERKVAPAALEALVPRIEKLDPWVELVALSAAWREHGPAALPWKKPWNKRLIAEHAPPTDAVSEALRVLELELYYRLGYLTAR